MLKYKNRPSAGHVFVNKSQQNNKKTPTHTQTRATQTTDVCMPNAPLKQ